MIITIDGASATGKSTLALALAEHFNLQYLETGAYYRAVAYEALQNGVSLEDEEKLTAIAKQLNLHFHLGGGVNRVVLRHEEVTQKLRDKGIGKAAAKICSLQGLRTEIIKQQKAHALAGGVVMEGRDTGTVVCPEADYKFFITATLESRARRRYHQTKQKDHQGVNQLKKTYEDLLARDSYEEAHTGDDFLPAPGAYRIETTLLTSEEVKQRAIDYITRRGQVA